MTLQELEEIKKDIESGLNYIDIAMNRGYSKAPLVAILNFEDLLLKKYQENYEEKLSSEIIKLQVEYNEEIERLNSEIDKLKSSNSFNEIKYLKELEENLRDEIKYLKELEENLRDEISFLNRQNINLKRKISKYENSFFSFLIRQSD